MTGPPTNSGWGDRPAGDGGGIAHSPGFPTFPETQENVGGTIDSFKIPEVSANCGNGGEQSGNAIGRFGLRSWRARCCSIYRAKSESFGPVLQKSGNFFCWIDKNAKNLTGGADR